MTKRLYYKDSNLLEFEAEIVKSYKEDNKYFTVLNQSAFYPTSGGQQYDKGFINNIEIVDVSEDESDGICHVSKSEIGAVGDKVSAVIDKTRRLRHQQQHTGQHILSHVFHELLKLRTESVHLGEEYGAVEVNGSEVSESQLNEIEESANEIIQNNLPVEILFVDSKEIDKLPMRKPPKRSGEIRIIKIGEIEYSACGGTHCNNTGEVGFMKIIGIEKIRGRVSVKFLCGLQLFDDYSARFDITSRLSKELTCHFSSLPAILDKLSNENKQLRYDLSLAQKELLPQIAKRIAEQAEKINNIDFVFHDIGAYDKKLSGQLVNMISDMLNGLAVLISDGKIYIACGEDSNLNAGKIAHSLSEKSNLKGGGNKKMAQLGGVDLEQLNDYKIIIIEIVKDE